MNFLLLKRYKGEIYATLSGLMYGLVGYFGIQIINDGHTIATMTFWRCITSALIAFIILKVRGYKLALYSPDVLKVFIYGAVFYGPSSILYFYASQHIGTGLAMVIFFIYPAIVVIINRVLYKIHISPIYYISIATIVGGMVLLADLGKGEFDLFGIILGLLSSLGFGAYVALCKTVEKIDPITSTFVVCLGCAFAGIIFALVGDRTFSIPCTMSSWIDIVVFSLVSTTLPILLFLESIKYISSTKASILSVLEPIFVIAFGVLLLDEKINFVQCLGVLIILVGAVIALRLKKE